MNLAVIVPAHNEEKHIAGVLKRIGKYSKNIIVVDDGSKDNTSKIAKESGAIVLKHILNLGKGAALKTGCEYAHKKYDALVLIDSDGQHDPEDIPKFVEALKNNQIVFGTRPLSKEMPPVQRLGNWFISRLSQFLFKIKMEDTQCGFRAFRSNIYKKIRWSSTDYAVESEMIALTGRHKLSYTTLPIKTIYLDRYKGTTPINGIKIVLSMITWKMWKRYEDKDIKRNST